MSGWRKLFLVATTATIVLAFTASAAQAVGITWPTNTSRTLNQPRTWNSSVAGDEFAGTATAGENTVAISNNGATNYVHQVEVTDGTGGAQDWNNAASRPAKYPYFGTNVSYGGNDAPMNNDGVLAHTPYFTGDCGVMRPHLLTDAFDPYCCGAWTPEQLGAGSTVTLAAGGVMTITSSNLAHFDGLAVGDRIQTTGASTSVFNRHATGSGGPSSIPSNTATNTDPVSNAPYWKVASTPAWNIITATPDVATAQPTQNATWAAGVATITGTKDGSSMFQGMAVGESVTLAGFAPAGYNGTFQVATAPISTPWKVTLTMAANPGAATATTFGTLTRTTDNFYTHRINSATAAGAVATYTTADTHGLIVGNTVIVSGMLPAAYNNGGVAITLTGVTGTTFTGTVSAAPGGASTQGGIGTVNSAATPATLPTLMRGSDCLHVLYTRSTDDGVTWDGGGTAVASPCGGAAPGTGSATCGSTNSFNIAGGSTNGGLKSQLSEIPTAGPEVQTYQNFVYVSFFTENGDPYYNNNTCTNDPRVMYLRVNNNYGAWNAWGAPIRVTPAAGQTNWPEMTVDQANGNVYILAPDANTGDMIVYKSINQGGSFTTTTVDHTAYVDHIEYMSPDDPANLYFTKGTGANNPYPCTNNWRGYPATANSDSQGFGYTQKIAAYNNNVAIAFIKNDGGTGTNNTGADRIIAKVSTDGGVTFPQVTCTVSTPNGYCSQQLSKAGAGGQCQGYGCTTGGTLECPYNFGGNVSTTAAPACGDDGLDNGISVVAGPNATGTRIDFAWVQDGGIAKTGSGSPGTTSRGLYFKEWTSTGNWGVDRLVSCMEGSGSGPSLNGTLTGSAATITAIAVNNVMGNPASWTYTVPNAYAVNDKVRVTGVHGVTAGIGGSYNGDFTVTAATATTFTVAATTNPGTPDRFGTSQKYSASYADPCVGKTAVTTYMDFEDPKLALWGTTGVGVVWVGCTIGPNLPCASNASDIGSQIVYKESGNSGAAWGADWAVAGSPFTKVAINASVAAPEPTTTDMWRNSDSPDLAFDVPTDSLSGCTQQAGGAPIAGCHRYVFFISRAGGTNAAYDNSYVQFLMRGVQT